MFPIKYNVRTILLLSLLFFLLLLLKRWNQLTEPEIWIEDGIYGIVQFTQVGWQTLFMNEGGFLKTINVLITNTGMSISPLYYPEISTYLAWIFSILVSLAVVYSPTELRFKLFAAISIYFIPTGLENFGLPYYSYFWAGILLFLVALWTPGKRFYLRTFYTLFAGLSSPMIFILAPIQIFRTIFIKEYRKQEVISLLIVLITFSIQYQIFSSDGYTGTPLQLNMDFISVYITKFYGLYYLRELTEDYYIQLFGGLLLIILFIGYWFQNKKDVYFYVIIAFLVGAGLSAILRKYLAIDPLTPGSRYYFYPYILLSWTILYISGKQLWYRFLSIPILLMSLVVSFHYPTRVHDKLSYKKYLIACSNPKNDINNIPQHINGAKSKLYPWRFSLSSKICQELLKNDSFDIPDNLKVFQTDLRSLPKLAFPKDFKYNIKLTDLRKDYPKILLFNEKNNTSPELELIQELDTMQYSLNALIENSDNISSLFIQIGKQLIFLDEEFDNATGEISIKDKLVFSEYKKDTPKALDNKKSEIKLCAINKEGTGYYELFNIPVTITDLKSKFHTLSEYKQNNSFFYDINQLGKFKHYLRIVGWFVEEDIDSSSFPIITPISVKVDDIQYLASYGKYRKDIAGGLANENYIYSGFAVYIPLDTLTKGKHEVTIYGLSQDRNKILTDSKIWEVFLE
jgi:hypothetical protein